MGDGRRRPSGQEARVAQLRRKFATAMRTKLPLRDLCDARAFEPTSLLAQPEHVHRVVPVTSRNLDLGREEGRNPPWAPSNHASGYG